MATRKRGGILSSVVSDPDPLGQPLTQRDLDDAPDDGNRYEVVDGTLYVTPFPNQAHQHVGTNLVILVGQHVVAEGLGRVYMSGLKVVLDELTGVGPDLVYIAKDRMHAMRADGYHGAPDLVVEVLSSRPALDTSIKKAKYERAGIRYYWIADPAAQALWEYRLEGAAYILLSETRGAARFRPELFPGLTIPLGQVWFDPDSP
jgi:Uma2 family endonuclease